MRVVLNQVMAGPQGVVHAGQEYDFPEKDAKHLLETAQAQTPEDYKKRLAADKKAREEAAEKKARN